ncbi:MAG: zf-HC2 domain-containing protein [Rhodoluna sp.]|jgi:phage-related protein
MSENNCEYTLGKVFDFLGNDLEEAEKNQVKNHLRECEGCRKEFAIESKISTLISSSSIDAQTSFTSKMQSRLQSEI